MRLSIKAGYVLGVLALGLAVLAEGHMGLMISGAVLFGASTIAQAIDGQK
jgi:hypothetical protein